MISIFLVNLEHLSAHEIKEPVPVSVGRNATYRVFVLEDGPGHVLDALLGVELCEDIDDTQEVDLGAVSRYEPSVLRLKECLGGSLLLVEQQVLGIGLEVDFDFFKVL